MYDMNREQLWVEQFANLPFLTSFFQLDINIQKGSHHEDLQSKTDDWGTCEAYGSWQKNSSSQHSNFEILKYSSLRIDLVSFFLVIIFRTSTEI